MGARPFTGLCKQLDPSVGTYGFESRYNLVKSPPHALSVQNARVMEKSYAKRTGDKYFLIQGIMLNGGIDAKSAREQKL